MSHFGSPIIKIIRKILQVAKKGICIPNICRTTSLMRVQLWGKGCEIKLGVIGNTSWRNMLGT
jgi:hypothetical protein